LHASLKGWEFQLSPMHTSKAKEEEEEEKEESDSS
jgi:hypothetical protein